MAEDIFHTTHWSLIYTARDEDSDSSGVALETLCQTYWYPLYVYVRHRGNSPHDAQDLTQAYFAKLLERNFLDEIDQNKGRFRAFLLATMKNFLLNEWQKSKAIKRGGETILVSMDAEELYQNEPINNLTAEDLFERRWAMIILDRVLDRLKDEMNYSGKGELFAQLKGLIEQGKIESTYAQIAADLGISEGAARTAAHRMKRRYRELLKEEISQTVSTSEDVDAEIRYLISILGKTA